MDVPRREFLGPSLRHAEESRLGTAIMRCDRRAGHAPDRGYVDDLSRSGLLHSRHDGLNRKECAPHMHAEHPVEICNADLAGLDPLSDPGIVDQNVDPTESFY